MAEGVQIYTGSNLEIFDISADEIMQGSVSTRFKDDGYEVGDFIIRRAFCDIPDNTPAVMRTLDDTLKAVDAHFIELSGSIGASVVEHTWGLVPRKSVYTYYYPNLECFGITKFILAARVKILPGRPINVVHDTDFTTLQQRLVAASEEQVTRRGWTSDADSVMQFTRNRVNGGETITLHDIEPRIRLSSRRLLPR